MSPRPTPSKEKAVEVDSTKETEARLKILTGLAKKLENGFTVRANHRISKDGEWDTSLRLYHSPLVDGDNYYSDKFNSEKPGRKRPTPNIVRTKCDTAIANSVSMQFAADEQNWDLFPQADSQDPADVERCQNMENVIKAQLDACNYPLQARKAMEDRVILGTGILKGPVNTGKLKTTYVKTGDQWVPRVVKDFSPTVERVPPWRFFPDLTVTTFEESPDAYQYHPWTKLDLAQRMKHPGFDKEAIMSILDPEYGMTPDMYNTDFLAGIKAGVWSSNYMHKERYTVLEYHGPVTYDEVNKLGLCPTYESPTAEYFGEVWVCCGKVIRMELSNIEGANRPPYHVATWKKDPRSPFGFGHPLILADAQRVITESYHMILDNASLTSGPQMSMMQQYIQPVDNDYTIRPNKVWLLNDPSIKIDDAISFFTPTNVIPNIMPVLQLAQQFADVESATTDVAAGLASPDNQESATGSLIMKAGSTTLLDFLAEEWDDSVTEPLIRGFYSWNMQYNTREDIKGDYAVDVKSSSEFKNKQMHIRDLERLSVETQQNPEMALWINQDQLQKARLALMHLPSNKIVRTTDEYKAALEERAQQPDPAQIQLQIAQAEAMRADRELDLKEQQLVFEKNQAQQREQWEHEEKQGSNYARVQEAQAQVIKARSEVETEQLKLAAKDRQQLAKMQSDALASQNANDAKLFMHSMTENRKAVEAQLAASELAYAQKHGKGI